MIVFWKKIKTFANQYVDNNTRWVLALICVMLLLAGVADGVNATVTHYPGNQYLPVAWLWLGPFMLVMLLVSCWAKHLSPRLARFTRFYTLYYFVALASGALMTGVQWTPFAPIDQVLARWDLALGVNTTAVLAWTAHHPMWHSLFQFGYLCITTQLFFLPAILAFFKDERPLYEYFFLTLAICLVSGSIYYFLPTAAPSSVFHSPYFSAAQHMTALKFYQIHHYIQPTSTAGGLIAFPSDHVLFALMAMYVARRRLWLFVPLVVVNVIGIVSTVMLGWHYVLDVLASGTIFLGLIALLHVFFKRSKSQASLKQSNRKIYE